MNDILANKFTEVIFIGLPGPTHNYGGLSGDNKASSFNQGHYSCPQAAALEALSLARLLDSLGVTVGILPPQLRPYLPELRKHFPGDEQTVLEQAAAQQPLLLEAMSSSSAMWVANAATITPVPDSNDHRLHITVANLHTNFHRRIEALPTYLTLRQMFTQVPDCVVHLPLEAAQGLRDEGAANHMRLAASHDAAGLHVFVYGTDENPRDPATARQTLSASQAIMQQHELSDLAAIFVKQSPLAITQGVFHNDVIAVSNADFLLVHEEAYALGRADIDYIAQSYAMRTGQTLHLRVVTRDELTLEEAIQTYFFNSQIVSLPQGGMALIAPSDTQEYADGKAWKLLERIRDESGNPITELHSVSLHQSMRNGGGPACLRLRVVMNAQQLSALRAHHSVLVDEAMLQRVEKIVKTHYPQRLHASEIDHALYLQCRTILQELGHCLHLDLLPD